MSIVIDASVLVAASTDFSAKGSWAESVLGHGPIVGPELILVEATNVLRRLERASKITKLEATAAHSDHLSLDIELLPFIPFAERVWELRHTVTSYDAWYIAVAEALGLRLATLDRKLSRSSGPTCEFLLPDLR